MISAWGDRANQYATDLVSKIRIELLTSSFPFLHDSLSQLELLVIGAISNKCSFNVFIGVINRSTQRLGISCWQTIIT